MEKIDYENLGFRCGIEIHQQLETHKLFCKCPSLVNDTNKPDILFERYLKASAGETGEIDKAALHEIKKSKKFIYEACSTSSCLVEYDDSPPEELNKNALETALQVALILKCKIVDEVIFMRKTVIDGSNTSGFQRTALIGYDGEIETSKGTIKIDTICLEEESAKKIKEDKTSTIFRLDRLGIPLIEIATDSSTKDPEHCKEVAAYLGMVLRSTGNAKRGIGSIRQDVNVSIKGHPRVEIKGFQDLRSISKIIEFEIKRQLKEKKGSAHVRKAEPDLTTSFLRPMPGASRMYPETDIQEIPITQKILDKIKLPELIDEKALKLERDYDLNDYLARDIVKENINFEYYLNKFKNVKPAVIANILVEIPKEIKARFNVDHKFKQEEFEKVLNLLNQGLITKEGALELLKDMAGGKKPDANKFAQVSEKEAEEFIKDLVKKNPNSPIGGLMGDIMNKYRGKLDGKKAIELLKKHYKSK
ncbi:MAG: Glu-tRNA(Gln) amidotransferase subunit GatE [Candidatus Woesearchaeota archaeon]|nr:MAG: Glu-tRNA(Gln) amidotransferase subunit GatE [Candidatus Woesearchaeota archaeon]